MFSFVIVDKYVIMRLGISMMLKSKYSDVQVHEFDSIHGFLTSKIQGRPDVVVMANTRALNDNGLDAISLFKNQYPDVPLIIYDEKQLGDLVAAYFESGVDGYLLTENISEELSDCITTVLKRERYLSPSLLPLLLEIFCKRNAISSGIEKLTIREREIARYLSQGMKTMWIAQALGRKPSTISTIKNTVLRKMKVRNIIELNRMIASDLS